MCYIQFINQIQHSKDVLVRANIFPRNLEWTPSLKAAERLSEVRGEGYFCLWNTAWWQHGKRLVRTPAFLWVFFFFAWAQGQSLTPKNQEDTLRENLSGMITMKETERSNTLSAGNLQVNFFPITNRPCLFCWVLSQLCRLSQGYHERQEKQS